MELQEFISESLKQIVNGVRSAQSENTTSARFNPSNLQLGDGAHKNLFDFTNKMLISNVEFDIAVTAEEGKGSKAGIGVFVGTVGLGTQGKSESKSSSASRIKFTVPLALPKEP